MADLAERLEDLVGPQQPLDEDAVRARVRQRRHRRWEITASTFTAAAALILVLGVVAGGGRDRAGLDVGPASPAQTTPVAGSSTELAFVDGGQLVVAEPAGDARRVVDLGIAGPVCGTCGLARVDDGIVLVQGRTAFWLRALGEPALALGPADAVYEALQPGSVWLYDGPNLRRVDVVTQTEREAVSISALPGTAVPARPAPSYRATGLEVPEGLVLHTQDPTQPAQLVLWDPAGQITTWTSAVDAVFVSAASTPVGSLIAWVPASCDRGLGDAERRPCSIHVANITAGTETVIAPPANTLGYIGGGSFSPDGAMLAAFAYTGTNWLLNPAADLTLIDLASGDATRVDRSQIPIGEPVAAAAWSTDGSTVFATGSVTGTRYELGAEGAAAIAGGDVGISLTVLTRAP